MIENNENKHFNLIFLGILIPLIFYCFLPMFGVELFSSIFALDSVFKIFILLIGLCVYFYSCYLGISKFIIMPVLLLFFYQIIFRCLIFYSPIIINIRTLILLLIAPIGLFFLKKYSFRKNFAPFIWLVGFYLLNLGYTIFNYASSPNHIYNMNLYLHKKSSILPHLYSIDLLIILTFLIIGIYFTLNIFKHENEKANVQFSRTLIGFMIVSSIIGIIGYIKGDHNLTNVTGGILRLNGFFTHSNGFAFFNVCCVTFLSIILPDTTDKKTKYFTMSAILLSMIAVFLSFSRINSLGIISILIINYTIFSKEKFKAMINILNFIIFSGIVFIATDFTINWNLSEILFARLNDTSSSDFRPMVLKYLATQVNLDGTLIYGNGIASCSNTLFRLFSDRFYINSPIVYHPHNSFVNVFYDYGFIGFLLYFSTLFSLLSTGIKNLFVNNRLNPSALVLTEILSFGIVASFVDSYTFNMEMLPFWILACIAYVNTLETSRKLELLRED